MAESKIAEKVMEKSKELLSGVAEDAAAIIPRDEASTAASVTCSDEPLKIPIAHIHLDRNHLFRSKSKLDSQLQSELQEGAYRNFILGRSAVARLSELHIHYIGYARLYSTRLIFESGWHSLIF